MRCRAPMTAAARNCRHQRRPLRAAATVAAAEHCLRDYSAMEPSGDWAKASCSLMSLECCLVAKHSRCQRRLSRQHCTPCTPTGRRHCRRNWRWRFRARSSQCRSRCSRRSSRCRCCRRRAARWSRPPMDSERCRRG